jgi:polyvinyl alcohol dehydrogenase (cytochrome)
MQVHGGRGRFWAVPATILAFAAPAGAPAKAALSDGAVLYKERCATCHDNNGASRAPAKAVLATRSPDQIFDVLSVGAMKPMAAGLSDADLDALAVHLTGKAPAHQATGIADLSRCTHAHTATAAGPGWNGWSPTLDNARFQATPGLRAADVARLRFKWAFAFPGGLAGQPAAVGGRLYFGTGAGDVYALDARTGCVVWQSAIKGGIRAAATLGRLGPSGRLAVFLGDRTGGVHALDAGTGHVIWSNQLDSHPFASITGAPVLYRGRLYVPVSSTEEVSSTIKDYRCCTFRGSLAALDAANGKLLWQTFMVDEKAKRFRTASDGGDAFGPAGAAIWSAPTIDARRGLVYVATGDSYTDVPVANSDSVLALDLASGKVRWRRQVTANDNWLVGCNGEKGQPPACPDQLGPDHDFGSSVILRSMGKGHDILLAGQKSGEVTALDPGHDGAVLWRAKLGFGGMLGGIEWGMAADRDRLFVPVADPSVPKADAKPGMYALRIRDGHLLWAYRAPEPDCTAAPKGSLLNLCTGGLSSAASAIPGFVFQGSLDGVLRAYDMRDGTIAWSANIGQKTYATRNAGPMKGDTINAGGPTIAGGMLYQVSGYQGANPKAMNMLLAFSVDGK